MDHIWAANYERNLVSKIADELNEAILKDTDLSNFATRITGLGRHQMWLGHDLKNQKVIDLGKHLFDLGGELQALALARMKRTGQIP